MGVTSLTPTSINLSSYLNKDKLVTKYKSWVPRLFNSNRPQLEVPRMILHLPPPDAVVGTVAAADWHGLRTSTSIQLIRFIAPRNLLLASRLLTLWLRRDDLHTVTVAITFVARVLVIKEVNTTVLMGLLLRLVIQRVLEVAGVGVVSAVVRSRCAVRASPVLLDGGSGTVPNQ